MSTGASPTPQIAIQIADAAAYNENSHTEACTATHGLVTENFGPTQVVLQNPQIKSPLQTGQTFNIRAGSPHNFHAGNLTYIGRLENGALLFRAPTPTTGR